MENGLTKEQALEKLKIFGKNQIDSRQLNSPLSILISQFTTLINAILVAAAFFSFVIKDYLDSFFIFAILLLNAFFGFIQEYKAEKSLEKLKDFIKPISRVIRNGKEIELPTSEIVPDDLIVITEGERIPADGKLLKSAHVEVDESILTGESLPVIKKEDDKVFKGTLLIKGKAMFLVEKTGMSTFLGEIAKTLVNIEVDKTPLQIRLEVLGKILSITAIFVALLLIPIGLIYQKSLFPLILLAVSIGIAAIPEGLPAVVTIALAIGTNRMAKRKAIVRKMPAVETLGSVSVILTDKTGTLTQNEMRVKKHYVYEKDNFKLFLKACVLGNTASLIQKTNKSEFDVLGDKTDGALLLFAKSNVDDLENLKNEGKIIDEYMFDPENKTITTVYKDKSKEFVYVRGAPEVILEKCKLNESEKEKAADIFKNYAKEGLRVIGFGYKILKENDNKSKREHLEKDLNFLGFLALHDEPKREAKEAIETAKNAGIKTVMVTGDNELTALSIAKEIGLVEKDEDVITGEELNKLKDEDLEKVILKTRIFARVKPNDKLKLVNVYKKLGFVVGVTGDGVNDALALKRADVGIAMGQKGTDVAKEAADIILLDDNYSTLVNAISEGRIIYHNILKSITYLLSGNLSELLLIFFATLLNLPSPLLPTQILWINLVTDGLPALALAGDKHNPYLLKHPPRNPDEPILTKSRLLFITFTGFFISIILLLTFNSLLKTNETFARTITFNLLIFLHLIIVFIVRGRSMFKLGKFLSITILLTIVLQLIITTTPFFQKIFHLGF